MELELNNKVQAEAARVSRLIAESGLYKRYLRAKEVVAKNADLSGKLAEYRRLNEEYRERVIFQNNEPQDYYHFDTEKHIGGLYWDLMLNETCAEYLRCEKELAAVISGAIEAFVKNCPLDL